VFDAGGEASLNSAIRVLVEIQVQANRVGGPAAEAAAVRQGRNDGHKTTLPS
jgi:hypothetical protein